MRFQGLTDLKCFQDSAANSKQPRRMVSVKDKLSKAFKGAIDSFRVMDQAVADHGGELATFSEQQKIAGLGTASSSAPGIVQLPEIEFQAPAPARGSISMGDFGGEREIVGARQETSYPSSIFLGGDSQPSYTQNFFADDDREPLHQTGELEYTAESDASEWATEANDSPRRLSAAYPGSFSADHRLSSPKDSTLQAIITQYHQMGMDMSQTSLVGFAAEEAHGLPIDFAPVSPDQSTVSLNETIATKVSKGSSDAPSPKTPDSNAFHTPHGHVIYSSAGAPPAIPLPFLDPQAEFHRRSFNPNAASPVTSGGDSYGDTRHLLMLSQQFNN
jgi:hypothetical protein